MSKQGNLKNNEAHAIACHQRWLARRNRKQEEGSYKDEWYQQQCGACRFFIPLTGILGADYGGCSNPASPFDKSLMFEHDGCEHFESSGEWEG